MMASDNWVPRIPLNYYSLMLTCTFSMTVCHNGGREEGHKIARGFEDV